MGWRHLLTNDLHTHDHNFVKNTSSSIHRSTLSTAAIFTTWHLTMDTTWCWLIPADIFAILTFLTHLWLNVKGVEVILINVQNMLLFFFSSSVDLYQFIYERLWNIFLPFYHCQHLIPEWIYCHENLRNNANCCRFSDKHPAGQMQVPFFCLWYDWMKLSTFRTNRGPLLMRHIGEVYVFENTKTLPAYLDRVNRFVVTFI